MKIFCFHKFDKVMDGYQYCVKCGIARKVECPHKWETIRIINEKSWRDNIHRIIYIKECVRCGELKQIDIE